jgi:hypothetical protein
MDWASLDVALRELTPTADAIACILRKRGRFLRFKLAFDMGFRSESGAVA